MQKTTATRRILESMIANAAISPNQHDGTHEALVAPESMAHV
jgi:hypothetical protein